MSNTQQQGAALGEFVDLAALHDLVKEKYPTRASLQWFVRNHRDALADAGVLIVVAGRLHFHPGKFSEFVVESGRAAALRG